MPTKDVAMSRESIQITYDGDPVDSGLMDVRDLAPALLSIGELCRDANRLINGTDSEVSVRVNADFKKGSFSIDLDLARTLIEQARNLLTGKGVDLDNLINLLFGAGGLIAILKLLKGEKDPVTTRIEDGNVRIEVKGKNNHVTVNPHVVPLLRDPQIRKSIDGLVRPLNKDGMKTFSVRRGKKTLQTVKRAEAKYLLEDGSSINDSSDAQNVTRTAYLEIIKISFKQQNQWTFSDGSGTFGASIEDREFLKKIEHHEMFGKGDQLKVLLKTTTAKLASGKYLSRHSIVQVVEIIRSRQTDLFKKT